MNLKTQDFRALVNVAGSKLVTDSRKVATAFGKQHKNVLRSIDAMRSSGAREIAEFWRLNFEPRDFIDERGKSYRLYEMTKDGFLELAMSFTGEAARLVRIRFIGAFNAMADFIKTRAFSIQEELRSVELRLLKEEDKASLHGSGLCKSKFTRPPLRQRRDELQSELQLQLQLT